MAFEGLVTELKRLIKDRVPGSQAKESIESFGTTKFLLELGFVSSSRTFGSDVAEEHENGQTVICDLIGHDLQVAVRMRPSANDWVGGLSRGDPFQVTGCLVSYDTLYDRAIFGYAVEREDSPRPTSVEAESVPSPMPKTLTRKVRPHEPKEVIRQAVRRPNPAKLPKKAGKRKPSDRKLYRKSSTAGDPGRDKRTFLGKPRNLKVVNRSGFKPKRGGHAVPSRKPLKRTLKSVSKANPRRREPTASPVAPPQSRVSNRNNPVIPQNPAEVVRVLQKKIAVGKRALSPREYETLKLAGLENIGGNPAGCSEISRRSIAILLLVISLPACVFSSGNTFGFVCLSCAIVLLIPDFLAK